MWKNFEELKLDCKLFIKEEKGTHEVLLTTRNQSEHSWSSNHKVQNRPLIELWCLSYYHNVTDRVLAQSDPCASGLAGGLSEGKKTTFYDRAWKCLHNVILFRSAVPNPSFYNNTGFILLYLSTTFRMKPVKVTIKSCDLNVHCQGQLRRCLPPAAAEDVMWWWSWVMRRSTVTPLTQPVVCSSWSESLLLRNLKNEQQDPDREFNIPVCACACVHVCVYLSSADMQHKQ